MSTDYSGAATPNAAVSDVPGALPLPSQEAPGASSEGKTIWCRMCDREGVALVKRHGLCRDCYNAAAALEAYFRRKPRKWCKNCNRSVKLFRGRLCQDCYNAHAALSKYWKASAPKIRTVREPQIRRPMALGEARPNAKLKDEQIPLIREQFYGGGKTESIARAYGVSKSTIVRIISRQVWGHVA